MKTFKCLAGLWVLSFFIFSPVFAGEAQDHILKGSQYVQSKELRKAVEEYEAALKIEPDNSKANLLMGLTLANLGEFEQAIRHTQKSIDSEPNYAAYNNLGLIYSNQSQYKKAIESYQKAVELSPQAHKSWYQMGLVYSSDMKFDKAIECFEKVLEIDPRFSDAYLGLGSSYYWSGDKTAALEQVAALKKAKAKDKAAALENWIKVKEEKKSGKS